MGSLHRKPFNGKFRAIWNANTKPLNHLRRIIKILRFGERRKHFNQKVSWNNSMPKSMKPPQTLMQNSRLPISLHLFFRLLSSIFSFLCHKKSILSIFLWQCGRNVKRCRITGKSGHFGFYNVKTLRYAKSQIPQQASIWAPNPWNVATKRTKRGQKGRSSITKVTQLWFGN